MDAKSNQARLLRVRRHPLTFNAAVHDMDRRPSRRSAYSLVHTLVLVLIGVLLSSPAAAKSDPARQIKRQEDALVRSLEAIYAKSMDIARSGDVDAYWRWRTAAARERPPYLDKSRLPLFAGMLPALQTLQFVRMDTTAQVARSVYKWPREDMARYTVVVYRIEDGAWKIDSITVRTDAFSNPQEQVLAQKLRQRNPDYHPER